MKKIIYFSILLTIIFYSCNTKEADIFEQISNTSQKHNSIHFEVEQIYYYADGIDTTITPFEAWAVRDSQDTVLNGFIWVDNNYRPYHFIYNKEDFYLVIPPKKTTVYFPELNESLISPVDWINIFLTPNQFTKLAKDSLVELVVSDTTFENKECKNIEIKVTGERGLINIYTYFIDEKDFVPVYSKLTRITDKYTYYEELFFRNFVFDDITMEELQEKQKQTLAQNPVNEERTEEVTSEELMLHVGDDVPLFTAQRYLTGEEFNLTDYIGKGVIIIDFWYTHCPPCVQAMPELNKLYLQYKDKGLKIFGLNSVDFQINQLDYLEKFLSKRKIAYDLIMINPDVDLIFKVGGYPTMYIVDKQGKIVYVEAGFNEEKFEELKAVVDSLCK